MYSWAERVLILEHHFASKSFAAVREAFSDAYPDKEVPNKTVHLLITKFRDTGSVCDKSNETSEITALPISNCGSAARPGYGCKNRYCHSFRHFMREGVHV
jgi:hypothetical protein